MRYAAPLVLLLMPLLPFAAAGSHGDCDGPGGNISLGIIDIAGVAYIDDRGYAQGNGIWIYLESNHQDGLQRGGSSIIIPNDSEICIDDSPNGPDTLIF